MDRRVLFLLPLILLMLLAALWSGLLRLGWELPLRETAAHHGALMVGSFLSTLIILERVATFKNRWLLLLPLINGLSGVFLAQKDLASGLPLLIAGAAGFTLLCGYFLYRYREAYFVLFLLGALCLLAGHILLLQSGLYRIAVPWWMGFLLFTIVAERLELTRFLPVTRLQKNLLWVALSICLAGLFLPFHGFGRTVFGAGIAGTAFWLLKNDMALRSIKAIGQHKYMGIALILGYLWLLVTAVFLIGDPGLALGYDAVLHTFFLGFVFSMIFAHATVIFPAVVKINVRPWHPVLYLWLMLLQITLALRTTADVMAMVPLRQISGLANTLVILAFFLNVALLIRIRMQQGKIN